MHPRRAAFLPAARAGGGLHPRRAAFLPAARAGGCTPGRPLSCLRQERKFCFFTWTEICQRAWKTNIVFAPDGGEELSTLQTRCYPPGGGCAPFQPLQGGLCPLDPRTGGSIPPTPLLRAGCVAARDEPPSCLRQGRVRGRTGQAAFLRSARAGVPFLQLGGNTRTRAEDSHRPSASERPKARNKVLCQAFFQESGRRVAARAVPTSWPA